MKRTFFSIDYIGEKLLNLGSCILVSKIKNYHVFFSISSPGLDTYPFFHFLSSLLCGQSGQQSRQFCKLPFFLLIITRSSCLAPDQDIRLYLNIPVEFVYLILQDRCWVVHKAFVRARGVMVIVVGNGHGDTSSNPGRD